MTHAEWWWIADIKRASRRDYYAGTLTSDDCDELYEMLTNG